MKFLRKFFILVSLVGVCLALYAWTPSLGYVEIVFLKYKVYMDIYILIGMLCILFFFKSFVINLVKWIKKHFGSHEIIISKKAIDDLARYIVASSPDLQLDVNFNICKQALLLQKGLQATQQRTGVKEVDLYSCKSELNSALGLNDVDYAIKLASQVIREFTPYVATVQDELLRIAVKAKLSGKCLDFEPSQSKYRLSQEFIANYYVKTGLAEVATITDVNQKIKILEKLHKRYSNDADVSEQLLHLLASIDGHSSYVSELISEIFRVRPNRALVDDFLKSCTGTDSSETALSLLKSVPDDNIEKIWFLLTVVVQDRKYPQIIKYIRLLKTNSENHMPLCKFYVDNYDILSAEPEIISLLRK